MDVRTITHEHAIVLVPDGALDTRSAHDFERAAIAAFEQGAHHIVVDFSKVDIVTSAALRVLVMLAKKLKKASRRLVLCSLNEMAQTVLDVSGLAHAFTVAANAQEAIAQLGGPVSAPAPASSTDRLATHVLKLLSLFEMLEVGAATPPPRSPAIEPLSATVLSLLSRQPTPSSR